MQIANRQIEGEVQIKGEKKGERGDGVRENIRKVERGWDSLVIYIVVN